MQEKVMGPHQSINQIRDDKMALVLAKIKESEDGAVLASHPGFQKMLTDAIYMVDYLKLEDITLEDGAIRIKGSQENPYLFNDPDDSSKKILGTWEDAIRVKIEFVNDGKNAYLRCSKYSGVLTNDGRAFDGSLTGEFSVFDESGVEINRARYCVSNIKPYRDVSSLFAQYKVDLPIAVFTRYSAVTFDLLREYNKNITPSINIEIASLKRRLVSDKTYVNNDFWVDGYSYGSERGNFGVFTRDISSKLCYANPNDDPTRLTSLFQIGSKDGHPSQGEYNCPGYRTQEEAIRAVCRSLPQCSVANVTSYSIGYSSPGK